MQRTLVLSDSHMQWRKVQTAIRNWKDRIIHLGDHFDSRIERRDTDVASTAWFVKDFVQNPNVINLWSNHDINYGVSPRGLLKCSGYSEYKYDKINSILSEEDWTRLKFFYAEEDFYFSHAGIVSQWFEDPIRGLNENIIKEKIDKAWDLLKTGVLEGSECIHAIGKGRDGRYAKHEKGGIVWADASEAELHPYVTQIFGHTFSSKIKTTYGPHNARNIKIDTDMGRCIIIEEDNSITEVNLWITPSLN